MTTTARWRFRLARRLAIWLVLAWGAPLAVWAAGPDHACVQCHPSPDAVYLESLNGPSAQAAGCPVLDRLSQSLRTLQHRLLLLEEDLAQARAAGVYVEPAARRLDGARARLAWLGSRRLASEAQARAWLVELERELGGQTASDLAQPAGRERGRVGVALVFSAGLGLFLAWLVGRRRELGDPGPDSVAEIDAGRLP